MGHPLISTSTQYTETFATDELGPGQAHHNYEVRAKRHDGGQDMEKPVLGKIHFQTGPVPSAGLNGIFQQDLLDILINQLGAFQNGPYPSDEGAEALDHLKAALELLNKRQKDRIARGVQGTLAK
jgi:hypothetical protein